MTVRLCAGCAGRLPKSPTKERDGYGCEWLFCDWKCSVLWRATQGDEEARRIVARMFKEPTT